MIIMRATVLVGRGSDKVMLRTNLPEACYPYNGYLTLDFHCAQDKGVEYVKTHFNLDADVVRLD